VTLTPRRRRTLAVLGVLALALIVFALPAGRRPFWSSDEARFALLAQDILDHGRWLVPRLRGELYLNKPQLFFWSIAVVSLPAGRVTELTAAIPTVASALATVGAVIAIGRLLWDLRVGLLAAVVLIATAPFYAFSHVALADMMMTAYMTWAMYFMLRAQRRDVGAVVLLAFYLCVAAAVLAKGPAGLAVLAAALVATAVTGGPPALRRLKPWYGLGVLAVTATVWFAPYLVQSGGGFVSRVLVGHYAPWYFSGGLAARLVRFIALLGNFLPWTVLLAAAVAWWPRCPDPGRRWIGTATMTLVVIVGLSGHQRARYLLPTYPGLALLVAEFVGRAGAEGGRRALAVGLWLSAAVAVGAAVAVPFLGNLVAGDDRVYLPGGHVEVVIIVLCALGAALSQALGAVRGAFAAGTAGAALCIAAAMVVEGVTYPARFARYSDPRPLVEAILREGPPGAAVVAYPDAHLSFDFYVHRPVIEAATPEKVAAWVTSVPAVVITTDTDSSALAPVLGPSARVVARRDVGGRRYVVIVP
jgi:4-amino-4-deoxy-L-arabinose transferase-like glycosyltransferase